MRILIENKNHVHHEAVGDLARQQDREVSRCLQALSEAVV